MELIHTGTAKRPACGAWLTLEQLAEQTHFQVCFGQFIEGDKFKDISPSLLSWQIL